MKVFISHSNSDNIIINEFIKALERLGCEIFYSSKAYTNSIDFGGNFYKTIKKEIENSDYILAMVSENFYNSIPCQIEMGIAYAFDKKVKPIAIENKDYRDLLKGIFTTNDRLATIYKEDDIMGILTLFSNENLRVLACTNDIKASVIAYKEISCDSIDKESETLERVNIKENYIEELIMTGQVDINECIFLKYMLEKRKYNFEWGWKAKIGIKKFTEWMDNRFYGVESDIEGDVQQVYEDIIKHFYSLELLDEYNSSNESNVELYKFKPEYVRQLILFYDKNPKIIDNECDKQDTTPF